MSGWQPIETAREATPLRPIDLYVPGKGRIVDAYQDPGGWYITREGWDGLGGRRVHAVLPTLPAPTHWREPPAAPEQDTTQHE